MHVGIIIVAGSVAVIVIVLAIYTLQKSTVVVIVVVVVYTVNRENFVVKKISLSRKSTKLNLMKYLHYEH